MMLTGFCPTVGVAGLALGGGYSFLSRTHGLVCDNITSMTVVTADSNIIEINENSYPDLFWALRGAGNGSFGIVVGFTFRLLPMFKVSFLKLEWDSDLRKLRISSMPGCNGYLNCQQR